MIRPPRLAALAFSTLALLACQGSELEPPVGSLDTSGPTDTSDATDGSADTDDTSVTSSIAWWFHTDSGALCEDAASCELFAEDELADHVATPGFQIDVEVELMGVAAGTEVVLTTGADTLARGVAVIGGGGTTNVVFSALTIPDVVGEQVLTVTTTDVYGEQISESKAITTSFTPCDVVVTVDAGADSCAVVASDAGEIGVTATVTHTGASCTMAELDFTWQGETTSLDPVALDEDGVATFFVPLGVEGDALDGPLSITGRVTHPSRASLNGEATVEPLVDTKAPTLTFVSPDEDTALVTLADDADDDPSNGLQLAVVGAVDESNASVAVVELFVDNISRGTALVDETSSFEFPPVTISADGTYELKLVATDACGNASQTVLAVPIRVSPAEITITSPVGGTSLRAVDDGDPDTTTVYETSMSVTVPGAADGATITLECSPNAEPRAWSALATSTVDGAALPADGVFVFDEVALDTDTLTQDVVCRALIDLPNPGISPEVGLRVGIPAPTLGPLTSPTANECLTTGVWTVSGTATGIDGQSVTVNVIDGAGDVAYTTTTGSVVAGAYTVTPNVGALPDGAYAVSVDARDVYGNVVSDTSTLPTVAVKLDRTLPVVELQSPGATVDALVTPDADEDKNGYQTSVTLHMNDASAAGGDLCLEVNGEDLGCKPVPDVGGTATWDGVTLVAGANTVDGYGRDACANSATRTTQTVTLLPAGPGVVLITAPATGAVLLAADDGDASTAAIYETDFMVSAPGARDGAVIGLECAAAGATPVYTALGSVTVDAANRPAGDVYTVSVAIDTAALGTSVLCRATIDLPEAGVSAAVALTVALPAPTLGALSAPTAGQCLNSSPMTVSGAATGLDGQPLMVSLTEAGGAEALSQTGGVIGAAAYDVEVDLGALADGAYTVGVDATDANGNVVSATSTPPTVAITIDRTAPTVALVSPSGTLDPANVPADADADGDPSNGYQHDVVVALTDAGAAGGQVCLEVNGAPQGCLAVVASGAGVTFPAVTLIAGENTLVATGTDGCANAADAATGTVTLLSTAPPVVVITTPASDLNTAEAAIDVVVTVTDAGGQPVVGLGAAVTLSVDGADSGITPTEPATADGTYTFAAVPLEAGANPLVAAATVGGVPGMSATVTVTRKTATPAIAITSPADGVLLSLASTACAEGATDCLTDVAAATTEVEDGRTATLDVDCGGAASSFDATVTGGAATWTGVTLLDGEACVLTASVTDAAGQDATSADVTVTVDRTAPTLTITSPPGSQLIPAQDLSATDAGLQFALTVEVSDIEAGQLVTVSLDHTAPDGTTAETTLTHLVTTDTPAGSTYVATFEDAPGAGWVTFLAGTYTLAVTASDAAGNVAGPVTKEVAVQTEEAVVRITGPAFLGDTACDATTPCPGTGVCNLADNRCYDRLGLNSTNTLITTTDNLQTTTQNLRVCSNAPGLASAGKPVCTTTLGGSTFYEVTRIDSTGGANGIALQSFLPDGYQTVVAETKPIANGPWQMSVDDPQANGRYRRFFVDYTRPVVTGLTSPSDTLPPANVLNIAEQAAPGRIYNVSFTSTEAGSAQIFVNSGAAVVTQPVAENTLTTVAVPLVEGVNTVWVVVTDKNGNKSIAPPTAGAPSYTATVDTTPPTVSFVKPSSGTILAGESRDVVVTCSEVGSSVVVSDGGVEVATTACDGGQAVFAHTSFGILSEGVHTLTATHADAAGNSVTAATSPASVTVDTVLPTGTLIAPADGTTFTDADDASADAGYQIAVDLATGGGATTWRLWVAANCTESFDCDPPTLRASGTVMNPDGQEPTQLVTINIDATTTRRVLTLETQDAAGNIAKTSVQLTFVLSDCTANFIDLPASGWFNASACADGISCASATVTITVRVVGACGAIGEVELDDHGVSIGSTAPDGAGDAAFLVTVSDGQSLELEGLALNGGGATVASTGTSDVSVDLSPPDVSFVAATVETFQTAAEGTTVVYNQALDLSTGSPGFQFHAQVQVADANIDGGAITGVTATAGSTVNLTPSNGPFPLALTGTSPLTRDLLNMTLADGATHTVTVSARDAAGNVGTSSFIAKVDITAPAAVPITNVVVVSKRRARFQVYYTAVGDDGTTGGAVASYDWRYSHEPITADNFASACSFSAPEIYVTRNLPAPGAPGVTQFAQIGGADIRDLDDDPCKLAPVFDDGSAPTDVAWYFAIRATDAVGNVSALEATSVATVTYAAGALETARIRFQSGTVFPTSFWSLRGHIVGDVNGDGLSDIIVGSEVVSGFCLIWGSNSWPKELTLNTASGATHRCLTDKAALAAAVFPGESIRSMAARLRPAGDVNGDGVADFLVTGKFGQTVDTGEAFTLVYFGKSGGPDLLAPNLVLRGMASTSAPYLGACSAGDFDGIANGTGLAGDLAVGEPAQNRVHVVPGNTAWTTSGRVVINVSDAAQRTTNKVFTIQGDFGATGSGGSAFGQQCGPAGDVLPTPSGTGDKGDLLVLQSGSADARIFVFPGREYAPGATVHVTENTNDPGFGTSEDLISVRLRQEASGIKSGFGAAFFGNQDMTGDRIPDVVAACKARSRLDNPPTPGDGKSVYVFDGSKFAGLVGTDIRVNATGPKAKYNWIGDNGFIVDASVNAEPGALAPLGNFDGVSLGSPPLPSIDLAVGSASASYLELRMAQTYTPAVLGRFPVRDGEVGNFYTPSGIYPIGTFIDSGDVTGDGQIDIVTGGGAGDLLIIR